MLFLTSADRVLASYQSSAPIVMGSPTDEIPPLPDSLIAELDADGHHLDVQPTSKSDAAAIATASPSGDRPTYVSYALATINDLGIEHEPDPTKPSKLELLIKNRPVWVVVFVRQVDSRRVEIGPVHRYPDPSLSPRPLATLRQVDYVDAMTNKLLYGESF
jgi:hypothetical protein